MNKSISLPIFFNNDNTEALKLCGIDYTISECETRDVIFYRIDSIADFFDGNDNQRQYSEIHSSGNCFLCMLSKKDVAQIISETWN